MMHGQKNIKQWTVQYRFEGLNRVLSRNEELVCCKNFASCLCEITLQNMVRLFASNECYIHVKQLILTRVETP